MQRLTVLYDEQCELCCRCRAWLQRQPLYVPLEFVSLHSPVLSRRFPGLADHHPEQEIIVIGDDDAIYRGGAAWLMCLWATQTYRPWCERLAHPALFPLVKKFCSAVSRNRLTLSSLLRRKPTVIAGQIAQADSGWCDDGRCGPIGKGW